MRVFFLKPYHLVVLALFLWVPSALASGPGPNGVNIGFDFNWNSGPGGYTASFVAAITPSGATLDNCAASPITSMSSSCDFAFSYSIGGVPQTPVNPGGVYETYPTPPNPPFCDTNPSNSAPLTMFNCFNNDTFGQIFEARVSGPLTAFAMPMTCLNPAGSPPTGLFALIYQANPGGTSIPATPLAATPVDLSTCPTLTSWSGHAFSSADFASIPMNFANVTLTAGSFYAVYFSGLVPGSQLATILPPTLTKAFGVASIGLDATTTLTFTLTNPSSIALTGVSFTDTLPSGLLIADPNGLTGSCGGGTISAPALTTTVSLAGATVPAGGSCSFSVTVLGTSLGSKDNTTSPVTSNEAPSGAAATASLSVAGPVPTLSTWGLLLLIAGLGALGAMALWRRNLAAR